MAARKTAAQRRRCNFSLSGHPPSNPSCGVNDGLRQPLSLYYRSHPSNPSKDRLTPSKTTIRCLFLALGCLCQPIPALYRCEQQNLPLWGIMQILVVAYLHKCMLFLLGWMELLGQISCLSVLTARRENCVRREDEKHRPTGFRKKSDYRSPGELMESKTKLLDQTPLAPNAMSVSERIWQMSHKMKPNAGNALRALISQSDRKEVARPFHGYNA